MAIATTTLIALAAIAASTAVTMYGQDTQAKQAEANANFAADQAAADAKAAQGEAQIEADRIRKAGKQQRAKAVAAAAASGVDVNSASAIRIDQEIVQNSEEDAVLTMLQGTDRAARLNQQGQADRIGGANARTAGRVAMGSTLLSAVGSAASYGGGWKKAPSSTSYGSPASSWSGGGTGGGP